MISWANLSNQTDVGIKGSVSNNTLRAYKSTLKTYERTICEMSKCMEDVPSAYPITEENIRNFLEYYRLKHSTTYPYLKQLLAGISYYFRSNNLPNLTLATSVVSYMNMLKRTMLKETPNAKVPVDKSMMQYLSSAIDQKNHHEVMIMTMCSMCFYGFLRISECCNLRNRDIWFDELERINIFIKNSKTDQEGRGVTVYVYKSETSYSAHFWLKMYLDGEKNLREFLFDIDPATFRRELKKLLNKIPISNEMIKKISSHSFRKGAAMCAARAGIQDCRIKAMGRWQSECYQRYTAVTMQDAAEAITKII